MVLACREVEKGLAAKKYIVTRTNSTKPKIFVKQLDLTSFNSIVKFADTINAEFKELYALVNNAAVFYHPQDLTEDGFEITFQTNYLGASPAAFPQIASRSSCRSVRANASAVESSKTLSTRQNCQCFLGGPQKRQRVRSESSDDLPDGVSVTFHGVWCFQVGR